MNTVIIDMDELMIDEAKARLLGRALRDGKLVAFPTETVYGLGGNGLEEQSVKNIYVAKGRPSDNPLILHISSIEEAKKIVQPWGNHVQRVMEAFWPGPLTLVLPKQEHIPESVTGGLPTVAIRFPSHPIAQAIIQAAEVPVAAPSANLSGKPSPTEAEHVIGDLYGRVDYIVNGGSCDFGVESTVLDMSEDIPMILRPGAITESMLTHVLGEVEVDPSLVTGVSDEVIPKAPGMKYRHYAPEAEMIVVQGKVPEVQQTIIDLYSQYGRKGAKVVVLAPKENAHNYLGLNVIETGSIQELKSVAHNLFKILRQIDKEDYTIILAEGYESEGIGESIMNRLRKAAGYKVITVGR